MPELLAGDIGWLGAGWLFASVLGALAQLAAPPAAPSAARIGSRRTRPRCGRRRTTQRAHTVRGRGRTLMFALLPALLLALLVSGAAQPAHAIAMTAVGALGGSWLVGRFGQRVRPRFVAATGCVLGFAAVAGGFAAHLLMPRHGVFERGVLYVAVSLGAWMLAASASAWFFGFTHDDSKRPRHRTARPAFDDRIAYGAALTLCAALACGFVAPDASAQLRLAALIASCALASALGVRMMIDARLAASRSRLSAVGARALVARPAPISLLGIPDELLVAACGGETFNAACLFPPGVDDGAHDGAWLPAWRRRRRGRYCASRQDGGRLH